MPSLWALGRLAGAVRGQLDVLEFRDCGCRRRSPGVIGTYSSLLPDICPELSNCLGLPSSQFKETP